MFEETSETSQQSDAEDETPSQRRARELLLGTNRPLEPEPNWRQRVRKWVDDMTTEEKRWWRMVIINSIIAVIVVVSLIILWPRIQDWADPIQLDGSRAPQPAMVEEVADATTIARVRVPADQLISATIARDVKGIAAAFGRDPHDPSMVMVPYGLEQANPLQRCENLTQVTNRRELTKREWEELPIGPVLYVFTCEATYRDGFKDDPRRIVVADKDNEPTVVASQLAYSATIDASPILGATPHIPQHDGGDPITITGKSSPQEFLILPGDYSIPVHYESPYVDTSDLKLLVHDKREQSSSLDLYSFTSALPTTDAFRPDLEKMLDLVLKQCQWPGKSADCPVAFAYEVKPGTTVTGKPTIRSATVNSTRLRGDTVNMWGTIVMHYTDPQGEEKTVENYWGINFYTVTLNEESLAWESVEFFQPEVR